MSILELGSVQIVTIWGTGNGGTKIDFFRHKNWIKLCLVRYELAPRRQTATWLWQLFELPKMACEGSSYVRTAQRSLGVYDLIAAAEWRELTSRYSALEQSDRTYDRSTQASATVHPSQ